MNKTAIDYVDYTWNPIVGCKNGCTFCYARKFALRGLGEYGEHPKHLRFEPRFLPDRLSEPMNYIKKGRRVFAVSMGDMWSVGVDHDWLIKVFGVMAACSWHTFLVLTKQPEFMCHDLNDDWVVGHIEEEFERWTHNYFEWPLPNLHVGVSITNQQDANERIPWLLKTPAKVRWLSIEPLHGPIDFGNLAWVKLPSAVHGDWPIGHHIKAEAGIHPAYINPHGAVSACVEGTRLGIKPDEMEWCRKLDWVVIGAETGNRKGKIAPERKWIDDLEDQCDAAGVPIFEKSNLWPIVKRDLIQQYPEVHP